MGSKELEVLHGIELKASDEQIEALGLFLCKKKYVEGLAKFFTKEEFRKFANDIIGAPKKED